MSDVRNLTINGTTYVVKDGVAREAIIEANEAIEQLSGYPVTVTGNGGAPRLHALKGYEDKGELLDDREGVEDVLGYAHSTFDKSKFTVVGTPTITDDGVASGFSGSSYITTPVINQGDNLDIFVQFKADNTSSNPQIMASKVIQGIVLSLATSNKIFMSLGNGSAWVAQVVAGTTTLSIDKDYYARFLYKDGYYRLFLSEDKINWSKECEYASATNFLPSTAFIIGAGRTPNNTNRFTGSIDLKQFSITVDGVEVFSGNKTGIDTIKPDDYTVVGTPTISGDGVASVFSTSNYLAYNNSITLGDDFEILTKFTTGSDVETEQCVVSSATTRRGFIIKLSAHRFRISVSGNTDNTYPWKDGGLWYGSQIIVTTNTTYYLKFGKKDGKYYIKVSTDGINWVNDFTSPTESSIIGTIPNLTIGLGRSRDNYAWLGSISLNAFKIYVDGNLVYQPCLKIPYTESKTGSKIVNSVYRDRVSDMYEQFGFANYYTLQDEAEDNYSVYGTPTISADEIASGFTTSNYILAPTVTLGNNFKLYLPFTLPSTISATQIYRMQVGGAFRFLLTIGSGLNVYFNFVDDNNVNSGNLNILDTNESVAGDSYIAVIELKNGTLTYGYIHNGVYIQKGTLTTALNFTTTINNFWIGRGGSEGYNGSIDLKELKIYVDNKLACEAVTESNFTLPQGELYGYLQSVRDLDRLSDKGNKRLRALKGYEDNGELLSDAEGLVDVTSYAHSTFDKSKFTVVGTPTITDDGIASGFDKNKYLVCTDTFDFNSADSWEIINKFKVSSFSHVQFFGGIGNANNYGLGLNINTNGNLVLNLSSVGNAWDLASNVSSTRTITIDTDYYMRRAFNGTAYTVDISTDSESWTNYITVNASTKKYSGATSFCIGYFAGLASPDRQFLGSIDLNQFSITVDGVEVFSGNKTGIDTIKPDDYTVVGTPTITSDGVASGFSSGNYLQIPVPDFSNANRWELFGKFRLNSIPVSAAQIVAGSMYNPLLVIATSQNKKLYFSLGTSTGSGWQNTNIPGNTDLEENKDYWFKMEFTGSEYVLSLSTDGENYNREAYFTSTEKLSYNSGYNLNLGTARGASGDYFSSGSIDLNAFKIYVDGNLVYQPCLKIPYTLSKTGSKIVNSVYRDRVSDMSEQFGYAPYYTLSDTNFTLPQGELYGLMSKCGGSKGEAARNIGEIVSSTLPLTDAGLHLLDGSLISGSGMYSDFVDYMGNLYNDDPTLSIFSQATKIYDCAMVGNITNTNGVLSNFSLDNYAVVKSTTSYFAPSSSSWEIVLKITTGSNVSDAQYIFCSMPGAIGFGDVHIDSAKFRLSLSANGTSGGIADNVSGSYTVLANTTYWLKLAFSGNAYTLSYSTNGTSYTTDISVSSSTSIYQSSYITLGIDYDGSNYRKPFLGSIDLNGSYVSINNMTWWEVTSVTAEENWQQSVTTYGVCGKFVYDSTNNTVRLPKYSNKIYTKDMASTAPVKGNGTTLGFMSAGSGTFGLQINNGSGNQDLFSSTSYGANVGAAHNTHYPASSNYGSLGITTDATKSGIVSDLANITTRQVSRGSAGEYQADERAGVARLSWRV